MAVGGSGGSDGWQWVAVVAAVMVVAVEKVLAEVATVVLVSVQEVVAVFAAVMVVAVPATLW